MNPFDVTPAHSEDENQAALFAFLRMCAGWGVYAAGDRLSYDSDNKGHASKIGHLPGGKLEQLRFVFAVPNGAALKDRRHGSIQKARGLTRGVWDIMVPIPSKGFHGMFLELKSSGDGAKLSKEQEQFGAHIRAVGFAADVQIGWQNAAKSIFQYLEIRT